MQKFLIAIPLLAAFGATVAFPGIRVARQVDGRVIGGKESTPHSRPYEAFIIFTTLRSSWRCGGALISNSYVLTAGHCVDGALGAQVYLGVHNSTEDESTQVKLLSEKFILHENFSDNEHLNDIGLIKLAGSVTLTPAIQLIALPSRADVSQREYENHTVTIAGWGVTDGSASKYPNVLMEVNVTVLAYSRCKEVYDEFQSYQICTSGTNNTGACYGDSGSPVIDDDKAIGLISYRSEYCTLDSPTASTGVGSFLDWIEQNSDVIVV